MTIVLPKEKTYTLGEFTLILDEETGELKILTYKGNIHIEPSSNNAIKLIPFKK